MIALSLLALSACAPDLAAEPPLPDRAVFEAEVYPVLLRDCAFPACHGDPDRFFRVHGPGRTRLDASTGLYDAPTDAELELAYDRARSMLSGAPTPDESWLVRKPLASSGAAHMGSDALGRNVYQDEREAGWRILAAWAGATVPEPEGP